MVLGGQGMTGFTQGFRQAGQDRQRRQEFEQQQQLNEQQMGLNEQRLESGEMDLEQAKMQIAHQKLLQEMKDSGGMAALANARDKQTGEWNKKNLAKAWSAYKHDPSLEAIKDEDGRFILKSKLGENHYAFESEQDAAKKLQDQLRSPEATLEEMQAQLEYWETPEDYALQTEQGYDVRPMTRTQAYRLRSQGYSVQPYEAVKKRFELQEKSRGQAPDVVDLGALGKGVWDPESGRYQPIKGTAKQGSGPEVKDYIYDTQDGRPATRGYITKQGNRVLFDQPVPGYLGETPKSVDPTEAKKAALDVDIKKQQKHSKSLEKALMPFKGSDENIVNDVNDMLRSGGMIGILNNAGHDALGKALQISRSARQKAEDERTWEERKAIEAVDLYDIIMEDTQDQYGMNLGLSSPQNLGSRLPPPTLNPDSGSRPGSDLRFSTQGYNMPSLGLQYQTVPQGDSWRNWVR